MNRRTKWLAGGVLALTMVGAGVGIGLAETNTEAGDEAEGTDSDQPLTGTDRERAEAAALEFVGGGTVIETEIGDDGATYGVEIRRDDGSEVEVNLDESFTVIGTEADDD
ncbi:MAG: hypothetical protein M3406_14030 [Chloroflexota bacterium]|nr:hypothetical protein [Chloroflexota bacterium]